MDVTALGLALALAACPPMAVCDPTVERPGVHDVTFAPLSGSERAYAALGPVGPFYPQRAIRQKGSGFAVTNGEAELECRVLADGVLEACKITSETPTGFGFGPAAKTMAERRRILAKDVPPTGEGWIIVRVPFDPKTPAAISP